ncbi:MAG: pilus assembly protein [Pseudomonadota bacterium]|nr:pilus assembly protein [Pseudomonadota bacterium]MDQ2704626.1 pilus assembly protein [Pseudomonadota bacterium]
MQSEPMDKERRRGLCARFLRNRDGSTAIEFTLLSIPFAALVFAILETCISFAGQQILSNVTDDIAREIRTGQLKPGPALTETALKTMICDRLEIIVSAAECPDALEVDLREFPTFAAAAAVRIKLTADRDIDTSGFDVDPGLSQSRNMLRVFYRWPVITDFMSKLVSNLKGGKTLHFATVTWQNEPFDD